MLKKRFLLLLLTLNLAVAGPRVLSAAEPAREFLNELREKQLFDVAVEYLDRIKDSPLVPPEFKETIQYERGVTLVKGAFFIKDYGLREKQLNEAQDVLREFIAGQPANPLISAANNELGNLLVQRAGMRIDRTKKPPGSGQKAALLKEARAMYEEALKLFAQMEADLKIKLEKLPKAIPPTETKLIEQRDQLRADYLQTQILTAAVKEEMADTEAKGSKSYNDLLLAAAKDYNEVYEKYRTRLAGLYARLYQGRCYVKMNNYKEALSYFADLLDQPDQPQEFRDLKVKTLLMTTECWFGESPKKYDDAIKRIAPFLDSARPDELKQEEFLALRLWLAKSYKAQGDDLKAREPSKVVEIKKALGDAKRIVTPLTKGESEIQDEAKKLAAQLIGIEESQPETKPEPKDFAEAKEAGKEALEAMQAANFSITELPNSIAAEKDATLKAELQKNLDEAKKAVITHRDEAFRYYKLALRMAGPETTSDDLSIIQYFLCFLHYNIGDYYESALLGEFIAHRYPDSSGARQSAKIALASYLKIYNEVKNAGESTSFESTRIVGVAEYIVKKWPDEPEATEAINTLIPFMIKEGKLDEAQGYLAKIPENAAPRGEAELKIGQSLWITYLNGMQSIRKREQEGVAAEADLQADRAKLDDVKKRAEKTLTDGVTRMQKSGDLTPTVASAVLSLGQIYVDTNQADKAVALLEDEKIGALTLALRKDPAISKEGQLAETFKTALRAYISSLPTSKDSTATVAKAKQMMDKMKETAGATPEGQKKLVSMYVSLAKELQAQMDNAGSVETKKSLSKGFETFLKEVGAGSTEMNVLNWVAETFYGIATSFDTEKAGLSVEAKKYYEEADATFSKMLERAKADKSFLTPQMHTQVRHRLAMTKRSLGDYKAAIDTFEEILKEHNAMLNVQVEAARTYQEWGAKGKDKSAKDRAAFYARAMMGAKPNEKKENVIWGWGMLAKRTATNKQFHDTFFEARYNLAVSRFRQAELYKKDEKEATMKLAKQDIRLTRAQFPELGGKEWESQYNDVLKKVQLALGEKSLGLAGLPDPRIKEGQVVVKADPKPDPKEVAAAKAAAEKAAADKLAAEANPPATTSPLFLTSVVVVAVVGLIITILVGVFLGRKRGHRRPLPGQPAAPVTLGKFAEP